MYERKFDLELKKNYFIGCLKYFLTIISIFKTVGTDF